MRRVLWTALVVMALSPVVALAGSGAGGGGQAGAFLGMPTGARPSGLGDAFASVSDDVDALHFNPGGLYQISGLAAQASYSVMSMDRTHYEGGAVWGGSRLGVVGVSMIGFGVGDIDERDDDGVVTGSFDDSEMALGLCYALRLWGRSGVGIGGKYIRHSLQDNGASGWAMDAGLHTTLFEGDGVFRRMRVGASASNVGGTLEWDTASSQADEIPTILRYGTAVDLDWGAVSILLAIEGSSLDGGPHEFHGGLEFWTGKTLGLRAGLDGEDLGFGGSVRAGGLRFDYSLCHDALEEGATHRIGVGWGV